MTAKRSFLRQPLVILGLVLLTSIPACKKQAQAPTAPPVPVVAADVVVRNQPVYIENIGQTRGSQDVEIRARVEGFLDTVDFKEGTLVRSNALLYRIDPRPFEASLKQAEATLAQAEAAWDKAKRDTNRFGPLWANKAISFQQYDDSLAAERSTAAAMLAAKAAAENAAINLGYTTIRAPLEGLAGKNEISAGNLVGRGSSTLLTTISSVDPIYARFSISEQDYLKFRKRSSSEGQARLAGQGIFELVLADGSVHPHKGDVTFADREVDPTTGTLLLSVSFPNPQGVIRPGQFARIRVPVEIITNAVLVPQRAVQELQANYSVYVVGAESKAEFRKIEPGPRVGNLVVVRSGLKPGDKVVIEGQQKLQNNAPINPVFTNFAALAASKPAGKL